MKNRAQLSRFKAHYTPPTYHELTERYRCGFAFLVHLPITSSHSLSLTVFPSTHTYSHLHSSTHPNTSQHATRTSRVWRFRYEFALFASFVRERRFIKRRLRRGATEQSRRLVRSTATLSDHLEFTSTSGASLTSSLTRAFDDATSTPAALNAAQHHAASQHYRRRRHAQRRLCCLFARKR